MGAQHWRHRTHTLRCDGRHQHQNEQMSGGRQRRGGVTTTRCALAVRTHARHPCAPRQTGLCGQAGPPAVWVWPLGLRGQCDAGRWCQMGPHRRHGGTGQVGNTAKPPPAVRPLPSPSPQTMPAKRPSLEVRVGGGGQDRRRRGGGGGRGEKGRGVGDKILWERGPAGLGRCRAAALWTPRPVPPWNHRGGAMSQGTFCPSGRESSILPPCTCIHIYTCTSIHLYTYTRIHLYTYTHIHLYTYTPIHPYTCTYICADG